MLSPAKHPAQIFTQRTLPGNNEIEFFIEVQEVWYIAVRAGVVKVQKPGFVKVTGFLKHGIFTLVIGLLYLQNFYNNA